MPGGPCPPGSRRRWRPIRAPAPGRSSTAVERRRRANRSEGQRLRTHAALRDRPVDHRRRARRRGRRGRHEPAGGPGRGRGRHLRDAGRASRRSTIRSGSSAEERERLAPVIRGRALAWAVAFAEVDEIDCINIYWAGLAAMRRAIEALAPAAEHLLIDGRRLRDVSTAAAEHHQGRHQEPVDRGGVDPGQDGARRAHARVRGRCIPDTASPSTRAIR